MNTQQTWSSRLAHAIVPAIPFLWLLALFATPFFIVFKMSRSEATSTKPPYSPQFDWNDISGFLSALNTENYVTLLGVPLSSFLPVLSITMLALLAGIPLAFFTASRLIRGRLIIAFLLGLPFFIFAIAFAMEKAGFPDFMEWLRITLWGIDQTEPTIPTHWNWLLRIYILLSPVVFFIV